MEQTIKVWAGNPTDKAGNEIPWDKQVKSLVDVAVIDQFDLRYAGYTFNFTIHRMLRPSADFRYTVTLTESGRSLVHVRDYTEAIEAARQKIDEQIKRSVYKGEDGEAEVARIFNTAIFDDNTVDVLPDDDEL